MKAIITKYVRATGGRVARIRASAEGVKSITCIYNYGSDTPHADAALALARKLGWTGTLVSGELPDGREVFCFLLDSEQHKI
jgi:uncharacterized protein YjhX (UPF0386 family)